MTSEICLMNRLSVVLAADSATTVSYWNGKEYEERYFKGANKIFQLSDKHPVGIMIYDGADLLGVPWEVIIKDFRRQLVERSFPSVEGYVDEFISYINDNIRFFPITIRSEHFLSMVNRIIIPVTFSEVAKVDAGEARTLDNLVDELKEVRNSNFADDVRIDQLAHSYGEKVREYIKDYAHQFLGYEDLQVEEEVVRAVLVKAMDLIASRESPATGLVFAGFGDHSVFPELVHLSDCRFWDDKFAEGRREMSGTDHEKPAVISGFAQTSMTDTFLIGFSLDVWVAMTDAVQNGIAETANELRDKHGLQLSPEDQNDMVVRANTRIREQVMDYARKEHSLPLRQVVGVLPVDEMGELAETMINLQSLKEKVTRPTETVGGPVDVAAITRSEGLVWLKRKHYFKPEINSRYFERRTHD